MRKRATISFKSQCDSIWLLSTLVLSLTERLTYTVRQIATHLWSGWLSKKLWYLQCTWTGDTAVLHWSTEIYFLKQHIPYYGIYKLLSWQLVFQWDPPTAQNVGPTLAWCWTDKSKVRPTLDQQLLLLGESILTGYYVQKVSTENMQTPYRGLCYLAIMSQTFSQWWHSFHMKAVLPLAKKFASDLCCFSDTGIPWTMRPTWHKRYLQRTI